MPRTSVHAVAFLAVLFLLQGCLESTQPPSPASPQTQASAAPPSEVVPAAKTPVSLAEDPRVKAEMPQIQGIAHRFLRALDHFEKEYPKTCSKYPPYLTADQIRNIRKKDPQAIALGLASLVVPEPKPGEKTSQNKTKPSSSDDPKDEDKSTGSKGSEKASQGQWYNDQTNWGIFNMLSGGGIVFAAQEATKPVSRRGGTAIGVAMMASGLLMFLAGSGALGLSEYKEAQKALACPANKDLQQELLALHRELSFLRLKVSAKE